MTPLDDLYGKGASRRLHDAFAYRDDRPKWSPQLAQPDGSVFVDRIEWENGATASLAFRADSVHWGSLQAFKKGLYGHLCSVLVPEVAIGSLAEVAKGSKAKGPGLLAELGVKRMTASPADSGSREALEERLPWQDGPKGLLVVGIP